MNERLQHAIPLADAVTVIIPTADRGELLARSVKSVLCQTLSPEKVLVVDNGIVARKCVFNDERVEVIRTAPHIGPGRSRNIGASQSRTEFIAFLDDDDFWLPDFLEQSIAVFRTSPAVDVVVGRLDRKRLDASPHPYKLFPEDPEAQRAVYFSNPGFGGTNITIRRGVFLSLGGFDELLLASEDRDLAARLLQWGARIAVAPDAVAVVCDHRGQRLRSKQLEGNRLFIVKHWRNMRWTERYKSCRIFLRRWFNNRLNRSG